jgi:hypothetical protein
MRSTLSGQFGEYLNLFALAAHRTVAPGTSILQPMHDIDRLFRGDNIKFRSKEVTF